MLKITHKFIPLATTGAVTFEAPAGTRFAGVTRFGGGVAVTMLMDYDEGNDGRTEYGQMRPPSPKQNYTLYVAKDGQQVPAGFRRCVGAFEQGGEMRYVLAQERD